MKLIGVIGGGECSKEIAALAEAVGEGLARHGFNLSQATCPDNQGTFSR